MPGYKTDHKFDLMNEFFYSGINIQTSNFKKIKIFWEKPRDSKDCTKIKGFEFVVVDKE